MAAHSSASTVPFSPPSSILIIGSGVFGLSTAWALVRRDIFSQCSITVVDRSDPSSAKPVFPARDASSIDSSRIVRADYADPAYAALGADALLQWRKRDLPDDLGAQGRYTESGLVLVADVPADAAVPSGALPAKKTGMDYARESWRNVSSMTSRDPALAGRIRELPDAVAIRDAVGTGGSSGSWGYFNQSSGWANAEASMAWLYEQVRRTGRVTFVAGTVASLEHDGLSVTGAKLSDGRALSADLVVLATGAWTGSLLDMSGQVTATGQALGYIDITEAEQEQLAKMPILLNMSTGFFVIPPSNRVLKLARHAYGYLNPTKMGVMPLSLASPATDTPTISHPVTDVDNPSLTIPVECAEDLRAALREMIPMPALYDRPFSRTRLCWYTDTATGDFLIDYHPHWQKLFLATGGSGHGFKFLPVIGDKIVDCMMGQCPSDFRDKWRWRLSTSSEPFVTVVTEDGSRGGKPGLILAEELRRRTN